MRRAQQTELELLVADIYELAGLLRRHGEAFAGSVGQTQARWQLLSVLSEGEWTVPRAARRLGVSRQAVQRVADELSAEGLVHYSPNPQHQRSVLVGLTPSGRDALTTITANANHWHAQVARDLDRQAIKDARDVLRQIRDRIAETDAEDTRAADLDLIASYRRQPTDPALVRSAARLATRTTPEW